MNKTINKDGSATIDFKGQTMEVKIDMEPRKDGGNSSCRTKLFFNLYGTQILFNQNGFEIVGEWERDDLIELMKEFIKTSEEIK